MRLPQTSPDAVTSTPQTCPRLTRSSTRGPGPRGRRGCGGAWSAAPAKPQETAEPELHARGATQVSGGAVDGRVLTTRHLIPRLASFDHTTHELTVRLPVGQSAAA